MAVGVLPAGRGGGRSIQIGKLSQNFSYCDASLKYTISIDYSINKQGFIGAMPSLNIGRWLHGCGGFVNSGNKV